MKTILALIALSLALSLTAAPVYSPTDARSQVKQPSLLPPKAPVYTKAQRLTLAAKFLASIPPGGVLYDIQVSTNGEVFLFGHQGANTTLNVYRSGVQNPAPNGPWTIIAGADCYPIAQDFIFQYPTLASIYPRLYFKGENIPCEPSATFTPAGALGAKHPLVITTKKGTKTYTVADVVGIQVQDGRAYKILP